MLMVPSLFSVSSATNFASSWVLITACEAKQKSRVVTSRERKQKEQEKKEENDNTSRIRSCFFSICEGHEKKFEFGIKVRSVHERFAVCLKRKCP